MSFEARKESAEAFIDGIKLKTLVDRILALLLQVSREGRISVLGGSITPLLCREPGCRKGGGLPFDCTEEAILSFHKAVDEAFAGYCCRDVEIGVLLKNGGRSDLVFSIAPVCDLDGRIKSVLAAGWDLTAMRECGRRSMERDKEAAVAQISAGVAHELNNPLTQITVYGEFLLGRMMEGGGDERNIERMRRMLDSAERVRQLSRTLTSYTRPLIGEMSLVSVEAIIERSISSCEHLLKEKDVKVVRRWVKDVTRICGIESDIERVFINIISNACQAMKKGGRLSISMGVKDCGELCVMFSDTGPGVPAHLRKRIFEPFFSTKQASSGTGLGLSIASRIISNHGGRIELDSGRKGGAVFRVVLPVAPESGKE